MMMSVHFTPIKIRHHLRQLMSIYLSNYLMVLIPITNLSKSQMEKPLDYAIIECVSENLSVTFDRPRAWP